MYNGFVLKGIIIMKKRPIILGAIAAALTLGCIGVAATSFNKQPTRLDADGAVSTQNGLFVRVTDPSTIRNGESLLVMGGYNNTFQQLAGASYHYWMTTEGSNFANVSDDYVVCNGELGELVTFYKNDDNSFYLKLNHFLDRTNWSNKIKSGYIVHEAYDNKGVTAFGDLYFREKKDKPSQDAARWTLNYDSAHGRMVIRSKSGRQLQWKQCSGYSWNSFIASTHTEWTSNINIYRKLDYSQNIDIEITKMPTKTQYYAGEKTDLTGLEIAVHFQRDNLTINSSYAQKPGWFKALDVCFYPPAGVFEWCGIRGTFPATVEHDTRHWRYYERSNSPQYTDLRGTYLLAFKSANIFYGDAVQSDERTYALSLEDIKNSNTTGEIVWTWNNTNPIADGYAEPNPEHDGASPEVVNNIVTIALEDGKYYLTVDNSAIGVSNKYIGFAGDGLLQYFDSGIDEGFDFAVTVDQDNHLLINGGTDMLVYDSRHTIESEPGVDPHLEQALRIFFVHLADKKSYHIPVELYRFKIESNEYLPEYKELESFRATFFNNTANFDATAQTKGIPSSNWNAIKQAYTGLKIDTKGYLASLTYTHDNVTAGSNEDMIDRYDSIINTYYNVDGGFEDFMLRGRATTLVTERNVTLNGINCVLTGASKATYNSSYTATIASGDHHSNPEFIVVTMGDEPLALDEQYTYNQQTGTITINANVIADDITITVESTFDGFSVVYLPGEGYGEHYIVNNLADGASINLATFAETEFVAPEWKSFKGWVINDTQYNPGTSYTVTADVVATAVYEYNYDSVEEIEDIRTLAALSYSYTVDQDDSFTFSNVAIRFSGFMSKAVWDALDEDLDIKGYGILFTDDYLDGVPLNHDNCTYDLYVDLTTKPHPNTATDALKAANGVEDLSKEYYAWNLKINLTDPYFKTVLTGTAYIKTASGYVFFNQLSTSVKDLAQGLLDKGSDTYEGSLNYLAAL